MARNIQLDENVIDALQRLEAQAKRLHVPLAEHLESFVEAPVSESKRDQHEIENWLKRFYAWANSHEPLPHVVDDSRESMYPDRW